MKPFQGFLIEKNGTAKELKYHEIESVDKDNKILWLHFDYTSKEANDWIRNSSNIDSVAVEALLTDETRPRTIVLNDALLIALRGVNLEPNSKPEKMISIRIFISSNVIISTSRKNILSVIEISENLKKGKGVKSSSEFLVELTYRMIDRMDSVIDKIEDRADFLEEKWLNLYNRTIYAVTPMSMIQADLTPVEKLKIIETYLLEVAQKIKKGYSNQRGTGKFIGYPVKEYITDYRKRVPNYDTSRLLQERNPQKVQRFVIEEDYFVYDSAIINLTEKQLVDRIGERVAELKKQYSGVYLIRMDENMHRESAKNAALKLHQFSEHTQDVHFEGFQPDFILYLQNAEFFVQVFIEPKGINLLEQDQWKQDLLTYINENEAELLFEDDVQGAKIKGLKFYTMNDGRGTMKQLAQVVLGHDFEGLTMHNQVELQD